MHSFFTSANLRHRTTVLNADVPNCYTVLKVVSIRLLTVASSIQQRAPRDLISVWDLIYLWNFVVYRSKISDINELKTHLIDEWCSLTS